MNEPRHGIDRFTKIKSLIKLLLISMLEVLLNIRKSQDTAKYIKHDASTFCYEEMASS